MVKRETITNELRFSIFKRDNFTCQYCGRKAPDVELWLDHIIPVCSGGDNRPSNLITACYKCNLGKSCDRVYEKEDKQALEQAEKNRSEIISKYGYYTNYIAKVIKNAGIKPQKKIIDSFTSKNFLSEDEFDEFKKVFYAKNPEEVYEMIKDCVNSGLKYSTYKICYTEKRKTLLRKCNTVFITDSKFIWQLHDLMKNYWCDHAIKRSGYIYQIANYFEAKHYEKTKEKMKQSDENELIELSDTLYCISEFIKDKDERMIKCFQLIDEYFEKEQEISLIRFIFETLKEYMEENGWKIRNRYADLTEKEIEIKRKAECDKAYPKIKMTLGIVERKKKDLRKEI